MNEWIDQSIHHFWMRRKKETRFVFEFLLIRFCLSFFLSFFLSSFLSFFRSFLLPPFLSFFLSRKSNKYCGGSKGSRSRGIEMRFYLLAIRWVAVCVRSMVDRVIDRVTCETQETGRRRETYSQPWGFQKKRRTIKENQEQQNDRTIGFRK